MVPYCIYSALAVRQYFLFFFLLIPPPPRSTLFPYTTLFRSIPGHAVRDEDEALRFILCIAAREDARSEEHTSELQSLRHLVCRLLLEKKKKIEICQYK